MATDSHGMNEAGAAGASDMALYAQDHPSAANLKARGAADRMWKKVEDDLERIDKAASEEDEDE